MLLRPLKDRQVSIAMWLARTPMRRLLKWMHHKLDRYMDLATNWNNGDEATNGEVFLIQSLAPRLQIVFDIGANVGHWSERLLAANPRCQVHCFEPAPTTFATLRQRFEGCGAVRLHQIGVGERRGVLAFYDYGANSVLSSFVSREHSIGLKADCVRTEVPVTTVDAFCEEQGLSQVDFIKIDAEGYEMAVLRGMASSLARQAIRLIQFEYGGTWLDARETLAGAHAWLRQHQYELYRLLPSGLEKIQYDCRRHECFKYANFVAAASPAVIEQLQIPVVAGGIDA
jgi:FkbM family methyltransferase